MDFGDIPLFAVMKKRLSWLTQRQQVLAQNIANADTPNYNPRDLRPFKFESLLRRHSAGLDIKMTRAGHLGGRRQTTSDFKTITNRRPYETSPSGNAVVLEEQMAKISENSMSYKLTTELYKKHLSLITTALGRK